MDTSTLSPSAVLANSSKPYVNSGQLPHSSSSKCIWASSSFSALSLCRQSAVCFCPTNGNVPGASLKRDAQFLQYLAKEKLRRLGQGAAVQNQAAAVPVTQPAVKALGFLVRLGGEQNHGIAGLLHLLFPGAHGKAARPLAPALRQHKQAIQKGQLIPE